MSLTRVFYPTETIPVAQLELLFRFSFSGAVFHSVCGINSFLLNTLWIIVGCPVERSYKTPEEEKVDTVNYMSHDTSHPADNISRQFMDLGCNSKIYNSIREFCFRADGVYSIIFMCTLLLPRHFWWLEVNETVKWHVQQMWSIEKWKKHLTSSRLSSWFSKHFHYCYCSGSFLGECFPSEHHVLHPPCCFSYVFIRTHKSVISPYNWSHCALLTVTSDVFCASCRRVSPTHPDLHGWLLNSLRWIPVLFLISWVTTGTRRLYTGSHRV